MPGKSNRDVEPSADSFQQPEAGSSNGVPRPTTTPEAADWEREALRVAGETPGTSPEEEWNLNELRLAQNFDVEAGGKKLLTTVPVRRPKRQEFVRVRSGHAWQLEAALLEVEEDHECYLVVAGLQKALVNDVQPVDIVLAMSSTGVLFLWPVKRGKSGRANNNWIISAQEGARLAQTHWVKIASNLELGAYEITKAAGHYPDPEWPVDKTFQDVLKLGFRDKVIRGGDHPVLRRLRGEI
jgi:hypothetical protein